MTARHAKPHTVYELWSGDTCLYVGVSGNVRRRINQHRLSQPWWPAVNNVKYTDCPNWSAAAHLERITIVRLCPQHNLRDNPERNPDYWVGRLPLEQWRGPAEIGDHWVTRGVTSDPSP